MPHVCAMYMRKAYINRPGEHQIWEIPYVICSVHYNVYQPHCYVTAFQFHHFVKYQPRDDHQFAPN